MLALFLPFVRKKTHFPRWVVPQLPWTPINRTTNPTPILCLIQGRLGKWVGKHWWRGARKEGVGKRCWVSKSTASVTPAKQSTIKSGRVNHFSGRKALQVKQRRGFRKEPLLGSLPQIWWDFSNFFAPKLWKSGPPQKANYRETGFLPLGGRPSNE